MEELGAREGLGVGGVQGTGEGELERGHVGEEGRFLPQRVAS
jgi:hypothetical protein